MSSSFYLEALRDNSSSDKPPLGDSLKSDSAATTTTPGRAGLPPYKTPSSSSAQHFRRARAETFSFFPPKLFPDDPVAAAVASTMPSPPAATHTTAVIGGPSPPTTAARNRSGSLSLPRAGIAGAFASQLFTSTWQPSNLAGGLSENPPTPQLHYAGSTGGEDETTAVARTLDYLGLDDPLDASARGQFSAAVSTSYSVTSRTSISVPSETIYTSRGRSYSVAVGENLTLNIPAPSSYRPRASSIAFLESTADSDIQALRRSLVRGDIELGMETGMAPDVAEMERQHSLGRSSPSYMSYPMDLLDSPTREHHNHQIPTRSLWIGNIDPTLSPSDLLTLFSPFGPIESLRILPDKECAFVNYVRTEDAVRARDEMQGGRVGNCIVRIGFGKAENCNDTGGMQPTKSLWIGNLVPTTDPAELEALFSGFGPIESARVLTHKNCGFVNFFRLEDAMEARKTMNGKEIGGSVVKIGYAKVPSKDAEQNSTSTSSLGMYPMSGNTSPVRERSASLTYGAGVPYNVGLYGSPARTNGGYPAVPGPQQGRVLMPGYEEALSSVNSSGGAGAGASQVADPQQRRDSSVTLEGLDALWNGGGTETYASAIPPIPEPKPNRRVDQGRLRELRKRLEGHVTMKDVEAMFNEIVEDTVDLCTDYIGNVVIQKIIEKSSDQHRLRIIELIAPHMAAIGIHKNGTWVIQKMIDYAKTSAQIQLIVTALTTYTPPLLLDQFGNYVVQCCLRLGSHRNQFVFDACISKCIDIGTGRFGARAMRACLESQYTTKRQQKGVAEAVIVNALQLVTNPNGAILVTWLLDTSSLPGRYTALAPKLAPHVPQLSTHKLASATVLKLVSQRVELSARETILHEIFWTSTKNLETILADQVHGVSVIQKILASACVNAEEKTRLADRVRAVLSEMSEVRDNQMGYKRLLDELATIPSSSASSLSTLSFSNFNEDVVSPLAPPPHANFTYLPPPGSMGPITSMGNMGMANMSTMGMGSLPYGFVNVNVTSPPQPGYGGFQRAPVYGMPGHQPGPYYMYPPPPPHTQSSRYADEQ
ncbi:hypothetical protein HDU85_001008 [Gaertneriomyces sp. JEL0708]|nr:hypothetical protein HDU85_001008 [Gaertneriomyces sp. JEL0708]